MSFYSIGNILGPNAGGAIIPPTDTNLVARARLDTQTAVTALRADQATLVAPEQGVPGIRQSAPIMPAPSMMTPPAQLMVPGAPPDAQPPGVTVAPAQAAMPGAVPLEPYPGTVPSRAAVFFNKPAVKWGLIGLGVVGVGALALRFARG